jgi:magnesium transporter
MMSQGSLRKAPGAAAMPAPHDALWIDLHDPDEAERARVASAVGLSIPTREALSEVETSSRLRRERHALVLSTPMIGPEGGFPVLRPLGFVLTPQRLLTVRFQTLPAFEEVGRRVAAEPGLAPTSLDLFLLIVEELVDGLADGLERAASDLDTLSGRIFEVETRTSADRQAPKARDRMLRRLLRHLGRHARELRKIRASLLGLGRIAPFVAGECGRGFPVADRARLETIRQDIESLDEFESRLSETVQFLLDATLGLINIEQNNTFKVLTIVSVVGIPPTLMASVYGMNFKHMPELDWAWGYPYGLAVIVASAVIPILYFKVRGWF